MNADFLLDDVDLSDHDFLALAGGVHCAADEDDCLLFAAAPQSPMMRTEDSCMAYKSNGSILPLYISSADYDASIPATSKRKLDNERILPSSSKGNEAREALVSGQLHKRRAQYCESPEYSTSSEFSESSGSDISSLANDGNDLSSADDVNKREHRLLRNRLSATKCRQKKKQEHFDMAAKMSELMREISNLKQENAGLRAHNTALMDHNRFLRDLVAQSKGETLLPSSILDVEGYSRQGSNPAASSAGVCTLGIVGVVVALKRIFGASAVTVTGRIVSAAAAVESHTSSNSGYDGSILSSPIYNASGALFALALVALVVFIVFEIKGRSAKK